MTDAALEQILDTIYTSLHNDNEGIDAHIAALKTLLAARNISSVELEPARLVQPNRQGRKLLQSYFKKRGVSVTWPDKTDA